MAPTKSTEQQQQLDAIKSMLDTHSKNIEFLVESVKTLLSVSGSGSGSGSGSDSDSDLKTKTKTKTTKKATKKTTKKTTKKEKDPGAPKKPLSAYIFFGNDKREEIRAEVEENNEDISKQELNRMTMQSIAEKWKLLSDEDKQPYVNMADEDKIRYNNEMKNYNKNENENENKNESENTSDEE